MNRPTRVALRLLGVLLAIAVMLFLAAILILPSDWFFNKVRERIITEVERTTGGRVEIGRFHFDWKTMEAVVSPFVLHGAEPPGERPLVRVETLKVGLRIVSMMKRDVDLAYVNLDQPYVNILVGPDGKTNFPQPRIGRTQKDIDPIEQLLRLAVQKFTASEGWIHYGDRKLPLDVRGERLNMSLDYNFAGPRYQGTLAFRQLHLATNRIGPLLVDFDSRIALESGRLLIEQASLAMPRSQIQVTGEMVNFRDPRLTFDVKAIGHMEELGKPLKVPIPPMGIVSFNGKVTYSSGESYQIKGAVAGKGLAFNQAGIRVNDIVLSGDMDLNKGGLWVRGVKLNALDGGFVGELELKEFRSYTVDGRIHGFTLASLARLRGVRNIPWGGRVAGPLKVTGSIGAAKDLQLKARLDVKQSGRGIPVNGLVDVGFNERENVLTLGKSFLVTPASRIDVSGTLGKLLTVRLESRDLNDLMPAIALASDNPPKELPVKLGEGGSVLFEGTVAGRTESPQISGQVTASNFFVRSQPVDRLVTSFDATRDGAQINSIAIGQDTLRLQGAATIGLQNWKLVPSSALSGKLNLQNARIGKLLAAQGQKLPIDGLLNASINVRGTFGEPEGVIQVVIDKPSAYGEDMDRFEGEVRLRAGGVEIINGRLDVQNGARVLIAGAYSHPDDDWKNGTLRFDVSSQNLMLPQIDTVRRDRPELRGALNVKGTAVIRVENAKLLPETINGNIDIAGLAMNGRQLGDISVNAVTNGQQLRATASGNLQGAKMQGSADIRLTGDYPGTGSIELSRTSIQVLQALVRPGATLSDIDGTIKASATFQGPLRKPEEIRASLTIPELSLHPTRRTRTARQNQELALRNEGPIVIDVDPVGVHIRNAQLVGPSTDLQAAGTIGLKEAGQWNLRVDGSMNLGILENFDKELIASGQTKLAASVRGSLRQPVLTGTMQLSNASFYVAGVPNGIDQANGTIRFDQTRATIVDAITAETGGGKLRLSGYVGLAGGQALYRLAARLDDVRVRYPEGVSTTATADLSFSGTTTQSTLTGLVSIRRIGFNPKTDVGGLLASTANPVSTPAAPNPFLRGMVLDVRIETIPNLELQTSYTNNIEAQADLRLKGNGAKPVLAGRVNIDSGEIQFFGTKYTINRGDIAFYNPVKIEPVVDLDLETTVRGVVVNISVSGTPQKLNLSYRSDPPLQSNEIIALLTVGRAPGANSSLASSQTVQSQNFLTSGSNALLGQAVAAPVSSRLQRFFGVSRLKIDPMLTGLNAVPQARLTVEQQISKDITLTYVTNLAQVNQQIIRVEWDLNRNWSLLAVREENGAFGIDFLYKKRFR